MVTLVFWLSSLFLLLLLLFLHFKEHLSVYICVLYAGEGGRGRENHLFCCLYSHENNRSHGSRTTSSARHTESAYETSLHALEVSLALSGFFSTPPDHCYFKTKFIQTRERHISLSMSTSNLSTKCTMYIFSIIRICISYNNVFMANSLFLL